MFMESLSAVNLPNLSKEQIKQMLDEQVMQGSNLSSSLSGSTFNPFAVPPETIVQAQQMALEYISRQQPKSLQEAEKENSYINEIQQKAAIS